MLGGHPPWPTSSDENVFRGAQELGTANELNFYGFTYVAARERPFMVDFGVCGIQTRE